MGHHYLVTHSLYNFKKGPYLPACQTQFGKIASLISLKQYPFTDSLTLSNSPIPITTFARSENNLWKKTFFDIKIKS